MIGGIELYIGYQTKAHSGFCGKESVIYLFGSDSGGRCYIQIELVLSFDRSKNLTDSAFQALVDAAEKFGG
jgi:hypothetical protein